MGTAKVKTPTGWEYIAVGATGPSGATTILTGAGAPGPADGGEGMFYLDTLNHILYGPKDGDTWPMALSSYIPPVEYSISFATAALVWVIDHNLGEYTVDVLTRDANGEEVIGDVVPISPNRVEVRWYAPMTGSALVSK